VTGYSERQGLDIMGANMPASKILSELIALSRTLGDPALDYAILGEGNSSAQIDDETFWVKASGAELRTIDASGFVRVRFDGALSMLETNGLGDAEVKAKLEAARIDPEATAHPSVETVLHALTLKLEGVNFVGHTHPTAVNAILCSCKAEEAIAGRLFPDEIVYCGPAPVYVPYTDPGVPLARAIRDAIHRYVDEYRENPKVILMQNHGLLALGKTASEVENITAMYVKTARVILGAYALGGPHFMSAEAVARIHTRPDEQYRRQEWDSG
jgi:rhamnose utilization protein RhaD (predicted bifunctional aldolase and dehydrogenase)